MIKVLTTGMAGYDKFYQRLITNFDLDRVSGIFPWRPLSRTDRRISSAFSAQRKKGCYALKLPEQGITTESRAARSSADFGLGRTIRSGLLKH